jgi:hypothetical protein
MFRKIIAGAAVAGVLTLGGLDLAGAAGATGAPTPSSRTTTPARCAKLPALEAKVHKVEAKVAARLPAIEAREVKSIGDGRTGRAHALANRVTRIQNHENKVKARLAKVQAACNARAGTATTGSGAG